MAKWGLFCALRYLDKQPEVRTCLPDGKPLRRPFGSWSERVRAEAGRLRSARRQPKWPRVLGFSLVSMALLAAVGGEYPMPQPIDPLVSARSRPVLVPITTGTSGPVVEGIPPILTWQGDLPPPYSFVLLDAEFVEIVRVPVGTRCLRPHNVPTLAARLGAGGDFHWFVAAESSHGPLQSPLQALEIR